MAKIILEKGDIFSFQMIDDGCDVVPNPDELAFGVVIDEERVLVFKLTRPKQFEIRALTGNYKDVKLCSSLKCKPELKLAFEVVRLLFREV